MSDLNEFLAAVVTILFGAIAYLLKRTLDRIDKIDDKLEKVGGDVGEMKARLDILWQDHTAPANSPRQLNERGQKILEESGVKEIVDARTDTLLEIVKKKEHKNPYDAEKAILETVANLADDPTLIDDLKTGAFRSGGDIQTVLFVGGIYLRNKIFPLLGFTLENPEEGRGVPELTSPSQPL